MRTVALHRSGPFAPTLSVAEWFAVLLSGAIGKRNRGVRARRSTNPPLISPKSKVGGEG
jgi:hypothetical protein